MHIYKNQQIKQIVEKVLIPLQFLPKKNANTGFTDLWNKSDANIKRWWELFFIAKIRISSL